MTRAYLRLDPAFDEHKEAYPDGPYAALVAVLCLAEQQPHRGRFRNLAFLRAILGKRGRHIAYLIDHGDLIEQEDGKLYVDGWDEWQEGDWKVVERVNRIRHRVHRNGKGNDDGNGPGNGGGNGSPYKRSGSGAEHSGALQKIVTREMDDEARARAGAGEFTTYAEALEAVRAEK